MQLFLTYNESRTGGEPINPADEWTDHKPEFIDFRPLKMYLNRPAEWQVEAIDIDFNAQKGDFVYLLAVRYATGSTFGTSHGNWKVEGVFKTVEEAASIKKLIEEDNQLYCEHSGGDKYVAVYKTGKPWGKPWLGYFESLEDVEIKVMEVV